MSALLRLPFIMHLLFLKMFISFLSSTVTQLSSQSCPSKMREDSAMPSRICVIYALGVTGARLIAVGLCVVPGEWFHLVSTQTVHSVLL